MLLDVFLKEEVELKVMDQQTQTAPVAKKRSFFSQNVLGLLFILFFLVVLSGTLFLIQRGGLGGVFGLPAVPAKLTLLPQGISTGNEGTYTLPYDQEVSVDVQLTTGQSEVDSVEAIISYDPTVLSAKEIHFNNNEFPTLDATLLSSIKKNGDVETGRISISRTAIPLPPYDDPDQLPPYDPAPANAEGVFATIKFRTLKETTSSSLLFEFLEQDDPNTPERENKNDSNVVLHGSQGDDVLGSVQNMTFSVEPAGSTAKLYFEPSNSTITLNGAQTTEIKVMLDTGSNQVDSVDAVINYTPNTFQIMDVVGGPVFREYPIPASGNRIDPTNATVIVSANIGTGDALTPVTGSGIHVATLIVKPLAEGTGTLTYKYEGFEAENDSNVVLYLQGRDILGEVVSSDYIIVQDGTGGDNVVLNVELLLQGRQRPNADKSAPVRLQVKNTAGQIVKEVNFNLNAQGKATNIVLSGVAAGSYSLDIKPIGYLQKRFTANLIVGQNTPDFSSHTFLGGDLDISGKVNILDYNRMLTQWNKARSTGADAAIADLDGSNQVNSLDYSILLSNWNKIGE